MSHPPETVIGVLIWGGYGGDAYVDSECNVQATDIYGRSVPTFQPNRCVNNSTLYVQISS